MEPTKPVVAEEAADQFVYADQEISSLHRKLASQLFHLVKKRDGQILRFEREKIVNAMF